MTGAFLFKYFLFFGYLYTILHVHFRGKKRFKLIRHLTDNWTPFSPVNVFMYFFSKPHVNTPFISLTHFPKLEPIQAQWEVIRDECLELHREGHLNNEDIGFRDVALYSFLRSGWSRFYLKWYNTDYESAKHLVPKTLAILRKIPSVKTAMFAILPPGGRLVLHRDPYAGSLRYHLGLATPNSDQCWLDVDGQTYSWRDGEAVMFDGSYLHHAVNESDQDRIVLLLDVERPMRFWFAAKINHLVGKVVGPATASPNVAGDKIGLFNRAFEHVYVLRRFGKRVKAWSPMVYYATKYTVMLALVYLIFLSW